MTERRPSNTHSNSSKNYMVNICLYTAFGYEVGVWKRVVCDGSCGDWARCL